MNRRLVALLLLSACVQRSSDKPLTSSKPIEPWDEEPSAVTTPLAARPPEVSRAELRYRPALPTVQCSGDLRVCVHSEGTSPEASAVLAASVDVLLGLRALRLPAVRSDVSDTGSPELDVYLDLNAEGAQAVSDPGNEAGAASDGGTTFVVTPALSRDCRSRHALATAIGSALLLSQDAATDQDVLAMLGGHLANLVAPCSDVLFDAVDAAQRAPERTFVGTLNEPAPAAFLFPQFLEDRFGTNEPGKLTTALVAISSQRSSKGPLNDEPDMFDALRVTQRRNGSSLADTLLEFAVARAFLGSRSDDQHMQDVSFLGAMGRVRFEWSVDHATLPRRLAPLRPIEPLGATYILLTLDQVAPDAEFTFAAEWEQPALFRWAIVKLREDGSELGRSEVTPVLGEFEIQRTVRDLSGARSVLIVGLHEGETRRDEPFDPGQFRERPRSYSVTLYP